MRRFVIVLLMTWGSLVAGLYWVAGQGIIPQRQQAGLLGGGVPPAGQSGVNLPGIDLFGLDADNTIWVKRACDSDFRRMIRVSPFLAGEALIGIDGRASDGYLYAVSDNGTIYQLVLFPGGQGTTVRVSVVSPRFAGGYQSLADFNPVVDALRLIGSSDENYAVVNSNGNLNVTAVQTAITYAAGDPNAGANPNLVGGAYTNNVAGAQTTLFYGLDYDRDVLVTIAPGANGSSATGGGQLTTIGRLLFFNGNPLNLQPTADADIYTDPAGNNLLIGVTGRTLFTVDLVTVAPGQDVTVRASGIGNGGLIDLAAVRALRGGRCN